MKYLRLLLTALLLLGVAPLSYGSVDYAASGTAAYGGKFKDVLKKSLISEASAASFEFIGYELKAPGNRKLNLPETTVLHAMVGGTLAQISGGYFTTGAIATAASHTEKRKRGQVLNVAEKGVKCCRKRGQMLQKKGSNVAEKGVKCCRKRGQVLNVEMICLTWCIEQY